MVGLNKGGGVKPKKRGLTGDSLVNFCISATDRSLFEKEDGLRCVCVRKGLKSRIKENLPNLTKYILFLLFKSQATVCHTSPTTPPPFPLDMSRV